MGSLHVVDNEHDKDENGIGDEVTREEDSHIIGDEKCSIPRTLSQREETTEEKRKKRVAWFDQTTEGEDEQDIGDRDMNGACVQIGTNLEQSETQHGREDEVEYRVHGNTDDNRGGEEEEEVIHEEEEEEEEERIKGGEEAQKRGGHEEKDKRVYVAVCDYTGTDEGELSLTEGETLVLFEGQEDDEWWIGTLESTGQMGLFPRRCVAVMHECT